MRKIMKQDVDEAWERWAAIDLSFSDPAPLDDALIPIAAVRMLAHQRFNSAFCDYVLQNEPERIVEVTRLEVTRALKERQNDLKEWREDWEILPESEAKNAAHRRYAEAHRCRMELVCLRHLWLASQAFTRSAWPSVRGRRGA